MKRNELLTTHSVIEYALIIIRPKRDARKPPESFSADYFQGESFLIIK